MYLYVIKLSGKDRDGNEINGFMSSDTILEDDNFVLQYVKNDKAFKKILTSFDSDQIAHICTKVTELTERAQGKLTINFTVDTYEFTSEQLGLLAKYNRERFGIQYHADNLMFDN